MSSTTDPVRSLQRCTVALSSAGLAAVIACGMWALLPRKDSPPSQDVTLDQPVAPIESEHNSTALSLDSFTARIWNPEAEPDDEPEAVTERPATRRPLNLQLIGITEEGDNRVAALYDQDNDRLHVVTHGQTIGDLTVTSITHQSVELDDGQGPRRIELLPMRSNSS